MHSKITIADIDNNNTPDLIRGNASGGLELFWGENFNTQTDIHEMDKVNIIPNPNNGIFTIETSQYLNSKLKIYSILGHQIIEKNITEKITQIDLSDHKKGVYMIHLNNELNPVRKSIIIH